VSSSQSAANQAGSTGSAGAATASFQDRLRYRFFEAATRGAPVEVTAEDGLRAVEIGDAAEQSARQVDPSSWEGTHDPR
jgi:hypothetical protein